jgi:hypothetical protein
MKGPHQSHLPSDYLFHLSVRNVITNGIAKIIDKKANTFCLVKVLKIIYMPALLQFKEDSYSIFKVIKKSDEHLFRARCKKERIPTSRQIDNSQAKKAELKISQIEPTNH